MESRCIEHTHADKTGTSWCGKKVALEWTFENIDHAVYNQLNEGRLTPCSDCVAKIVSLLTMR